MKIISVVGARPQFIKLAPIARAFANKPDVEHQVIHTGQHYDQNLSDIFFTELDLPKPKYHLNIGSHTHAKQTGLALIELESIFIKEKPDHVIVFGDTNATLSAALAARKLNFPLSHIEAGLRSYNNAMPEEINRIITDKLSTYLFCTDNTSVTNLKAEGISHNVFQVGDVMVDQLCHVIKQTDGDSSEAGHILLTLHRQEACYSNQQLKSIFSRLNQLALDHPIIFPTHPRIKAHLNALEIKPNKNLKLIPPVGYKQILTLLKTAKCAITDSGGLQKEAYLLKTPCITLRSETEWVDTLTHDWNQVVGFDLDKFNRAFQQALNFDRNTPHSAYYGQGDSAEKIISTLLENS